MAEAGAAGAGLAPSVPPPPAPAAEPGLPQLSTLLARAEGALDARRFDEAVGLFDEVLRLEPGNDRAREGRARANRSRDFARRSLVSGRTAVLTGESDKSPEGFETEGLRVLKQPRYLGRINFEVNPRSPQPGEAVSWRTHLTNDGKKKFKIASVTVKRMLNGATTEESIPFDQEIEPGQKILLHEATELWHEETSSWSLEVTAATHGQETFRSRLRWQ